jgi:hypothetical protein
MRLPEHVGCPRHPYADRRTRRPQGCADCRVGGPVVLGATVPASVTTGPVGWGGQKAVEAGDVGGEVRVGGGRAARRRAWVLRCQEAEVSAQRAMA